MIKYIKKLIKKQRLLKKYKKNDKEWNNHIWLLNNFKWSKDEENYFNHQFYCELRCYRRIKNLK